MSLPHERPPATERARILVVEDDPSLNERLRQVLAERWEAVGALSAGQALERLEADHYDLLLLDLQLPDRDGLDLLDEAEHAGLISRAIILTGHAALGSAVRALQLRSLDYLAKPIDPPLLVEKVAGALAAKPLVVAPLEAVLGRARRFLRAGKLREGRSQLQAARLRYPKSPEVLNLLGVAAEMAHDLNTAVDYYHLAHELERPYPPALRNSERLVHRSWKGPGAGQAIDFGDAEPARGRDRA